MKIEVIEYIHEGGMKNYYVVRVYESAKDLVIRRWGRIGTAGQLKVSHHPSKQSSAEDVTREHRKRLKKGYVRGRHIFLNLDTNWKKSAGAQLNDATFLNRLEEELHRNLGSDFMLHTMTEPEPEPLADIDRGAIWGSW